MFEKVLIANRGEIGSAIGFIRSVAARWSIPHVAVHFPAECRTMHVRLAA
jgi:acetyl/propionyl-CoA carboxylase alpha subunit